jgi:GT2 family glycosyltransferase
MTLPKVSIIILNWNGIDDTLECIHSVYKNNYPSFDVVVVDNGSTDNSVECLERLKKENYYLLKNNENLGYSGGMNTGIEFALASLNPGLVLLMNNDVLVDKNYLSEMVATAQEKTEYGIIGPKSYYFDYKGKKNVINFAGGGINTWLGVCWHIGNRQEDQGQYEKETVVDYITGSCLLVKTEVIKKIGLLNPAYFAYWEETEWCVSARKNGWLCVYSPKAKIWHKLGGSFGSETSPFSEYYVTRNSFIFIKRNASILQQFTFLCFFALVKLPLKVIKTRNPDIFDAFKRGTRDGIKHFMVR